MPSSPECETGRSLAELVPCLEPELGQKSTYQDFLSSGKTQVHDIPILQRQNGNSASWNDCRTSTAVGIPQRDGPTKKSNCCWFAKTNHRNFDLFFSQSCSEHSLTATAGNIKARALCNRFPIPRHDRPASCLQCQARRIWLDMCLRGAHRYPVPCSVRVRFRCCSRLPCHFGVLASP